MSRTKTFGTILASLLVGAIAFLFVSPKKVNKRKDVKIISEREVDANQNLFI